MTQKWKKVGALCFLLSVPVLMLIYPYLNTSDRGVHTHTVPFCKRFNL
jgi:hypothetical protein